MFNFTVGQEFPKLHNCASMVKKNGFTIIKYKYIIASSF